MSVEPSAGKEGQENLWLTTCETEWDASSKAGAGWDGRV